MSDNTNILEVDRLSNHYEGKPLLQDISFSLKQGEILCLLGPSGSGKTTLLRLLAGLEKEEAGTIRFCGKDVRDTPPHKRNFGMMFQEYALFPHKSLQQNVAFGLEMQQCPREELYKRVKTVLEMVGLSGMENRNIDELSGGERQRVALARSLAPQPQLLLLDEPLGSLDRALRDRLTVEIRTILYSNCHLRYPRSGRSL
jgi:ABC-type Fe3+/spermidine/putrescine transport system ATPase subunit